MIVGIDLGTTNSLVAVYEDDEAKIVPNRLGKRLTPSVVAVDDEDNVMVGELAKEYGYLNPGRMAKVFKRSMGTDKEYTLGKHRFNSEELSSFVLRYLKEDAEAYLGNQVDEAIISVPAYFNDSQRKATVKAGELAGLKVLRIISEPTASAVAYGIGKDDENERCMVLDLGGGTFDVSILEYFQNIMEVHSIAGDNMLGGEDFTSALMDLFLSKTGLSLSLLTLGEIAELYKMAEKAKCTFSKYDDVMMAMGPFSVAINSEEYREYCQPLLERLRKPIEKSLRDSKISLDDIDRIVLVGGATRLPMVRKYINTVTGIYPDHYVDPDCSVALGAALQAAMKKREKSIEEIILTDVCPFTLGTEVVEFNGSFDEPGHYLPIIQRNTVIPVSKTQRVYTAHENQKSVNVKVLQGESRMAHNNFFLGNVEVEVPVGPKGQEAVDITYTYDVDSLLEVEVSVVSTKETKKIVIQRSENKLSDDEVEKRLQVLSKLKFNPRADERNQLLIMKGNRLYEELMGPEKGKLSEELTKFEALLGKGDRLEIERARKHLESVLDSFDDDDEVVLLS